MTDNNKFIQKMPETYEVRFVENQEQQRQQEQTEQKSITEKAKEAVVPTVHASDSKEDKGSSNDGRGSPKIVQADNSWVKNTMEAKREFDRRKGMEDTSCDIQ